VRFAATIEALRAMPPVRREIAYRRAARVARRALARGEDLRDAPSDISALHALRCALRRLRYALEWLEEDSTSIAALQQLLGDACDRFVALKGLRRGSARPSGRRYRRRPKRELDHFVLRAFARWKAVGVGRRDAGGASHAFLRRIREFDVRDEGSRPSHLRSGCVRTKSPRSADGTCERHGDRIA
jgi:hypothetical protein